MTLTDEPLVASEAPSGERWRSPVALSLAIGAVAAVVTTARAGVGSALLLAALAIGLAQLVGHASGARRLLAAAAALLPFLVIRDNSWLALCIVFTGGLVGAYTTIVAGTGQSVFHARLGALLRLQPRPDRPPSPLPQTDRSIDALALSVFRGSFLAIVITSLFWALLADADQVFASMVDLGQLPVGRFGFGALVAALFLPVALLASLRRTALRSTERRPLGMVECGIVLAALDLLFLAFVVLRLGNLGTPLSEDAWRSEVRSGFFQLLFVAALTIALVLALRRIVRVDSPAQLTRFRQLAVATIVLAGLIDVIALQRIAEYVQRNFMTPLRWWSFGFGIFLMVVLGIVAARVVGWRSDREWVSGAVICTWLAFVAAMAVSNPDQRMADYNFDHPREADGVISVQALFWLSEDATPVIVDRIDALRPLSNTRFERMVAHLCATEPQDSWRQFNFARSDAAATTKELCGP